MHTRRLLVLFYAPVYSTQEPSVGKGLLGAEMLKY